MVNVWIGIASMRSVISLERGSAAAGENKALTMEIRSAIVRCFILFQCPKIDDVTSRDRPYRRQRLPIIERRFGTTALSGKTRLAESRCLIWPNCNGANRVFSAVRHLYFRHRIRPIGCDDRTARS